MVRRGWMVVSVVVVCIAGCSGSDTPPAGTPPQEAGTHVELAVTTTGNGTVISSPAGIHCGTACTATFDPGTSVTLSPVPAEGGVFAGWSGACTGTAPCLIAMDADKSVHALFNMPPPVSATLTVTSAGTGSGTVSSSPGGINGCASTCTATFPLSSTVTLTATPINGSSFTGWSPNCPAASQCTVVLNGNQTVTATFTSAPTLSDLTIFGASQGLSGSVIDAGPDDAQNIWAATPDALFVLLRGETMFRRFSATDGLHIQPFTDFDGQPAASNITAIAAGLPGQVFVGYRGFDATIPPPAPPRCCVANADFSDPRWSLGQADKITLKPDGALDVLRYEFRCDLPNCWENSSVRRMVFAHQGAAAGHLFVGFSHGVTHVFNDVFGDHIHINTWWHYPDGTLVQQMGEQYGLFVLPTGELLSGAINGVGLFNWNPDPKAWVRGSFRWVFTTYGPAAPFNGGPHTLDVPAGYMEHQRGVAMTSDGTAWFASVTQGLGSYNHTTARGDTSQIRTYTTVPGLPASGFIDLTADPDGTLWLVHNGGTLFRLNPANLSVQAWPGISGARRVVVDTTVVPRAVYVSMGSNGLAVIRAR